MSLPLVSLHKRVNQDIAFVILDFAIVKVPKPTALVWPMEYQTQSSNETIVMNSEVRLQLSDSNADSVDPAKVQPNLSKTLILRFLEFS